jgi:hypothetical protein
MFWISQNAVVTRIECRQGNLLLRLRYYIVVLFSLSGQYLKNAAGGRFLPDPSLSYDVSELYSLEILTNKRDVKWLMP